MKKSALSNLSFNFDSTSRKKDNTQKNAYTVTALTGLIKEQLENNIQDIWVEGEISNFKRAPSGHLYFSLKDENSQISAVIWKGMSKYIRFDLEDGQKILCRGNINVYPPRGTYQIIIQQIEPRGVGALQLAFEQLKGKLQKEGLFDLEHKRSIPFLPRKIGIVTSHTGAAIRDIIRIIGDRYDTYNLVIFSTRVQGKEASKEIAQAIHYLNKNYTDIDVIILGRGGGSLEDLWSFNEEVVARSIYASRIPIIAAIGHEVDISIADFVADVRASTPSAAAEMVIPEKAELVKQLYKLSTQLASHLRAQVEIAKQKIKALEKSSAWSTPYELIESGSQTIDELMELIRTIMLRYIDDVKAQLQLMSTQLDGHSPLKIFEKGYSLTMDSSKDRILRSVKDINEGDILRTYLQDGEIYSQVNAKRIIKRNI